MRAVPCIPTVADMQVSAVVNDRILRRILTFAGLPTFLGFALFPLFYWVKVPFSFPMRLHCLVGHRVQASTLVREVAAA